MADTDDATDTPWLSAEQHEAWMALVGVLVRLHPALDAQLRRDADISHFEYTVLAALSESPAGTRRMSELAAMAAGSLSRLSQVVGRLESRGWVRRVTDPTDGRYTLAILTESGTEKVVATAPGHVCEVRHLIFDPLTKAQVGQLTGIARRIAGAIDSSDSCR